MTKKAKYRPVLTAEQIVHIMSLCKSELPISDASISVIGSLGLFYAKIENRGIQAAYEAVEPKPPVNNLEALGEAPKDPIEEHGNKELYWRVCYTKYKLRPTSCSLDEIEAAQEHMYLNDLMSPEEITAFEKKSFNL